jgi:hypothetical protein
VVFEEPTLSAKARGKVVRREGGRMAVAFLWESAAAREAFSSALYGSRPRSTAELDTLLPKPEAMQA